MGAMIGFLVGIVIGLIGGVSLTCVVVSGNNK